MNWSIEVDDVLCGNSSDHVKIDHEQRQSIDRSECPSQERAIEYYFRKDRLHVLKLHCNHVYVRTYVRCKGIIIKVVIRVLSTVPTNYHLQHVLVLYCMILYNTSTPN